MTYYTNEEREFTGPEVDEAGNQIVSWSWDFGDGHTAEDRISTHDYTNPGEYQVVLQTVNDCGAVSDLNNLECQQTLVIESEEPSSINFYIIMSLMAVAFLFGIIRNIKK